MDLFYREYGNYSDDRPTLIFLHGLLGSSANWHSIARAVGDEYHILVPDLRNHGRSPHDSEVGYPALVADLEGFLDDQGLDSAVLIGHSMGGKTAMAYALEHPSMVGALVVVDIAPVRYDSRFTELFDVLSRLDLSMIESREAADRQLARFLSDLRLRQYLLQNLRVSGGRSEWRINIEALSRRLEDILTFPDVPKGTQYPGPALFLYGTESDYVQPASASVISGYFPYARLRPVNGAGHWVYSEQPEFFMNALTRFLGKEVL